MMKLLNKQLDLQIAHDNEHEADYEAMLESMNTEKQRRLTHEKQRINVLEGRDLYELNAKEYDQEQRDNAGFEDLFSTEYLFTHTTADVNEFSQFQQYV